MGIRTSRIDALTFGLGSGIAGMAGVALSQIDNVSPNLGQGYIIDSFMVVVFGGVGNLWGTLVGASRSASPTNSSSRSPARCSARSPSWCSSSSSSRNGRAACSRSRAGRSRHDLAYPHSLARSQRDDFPHRRRGDRRRGADSQSGGAAIVGAACADLSGGVVRQIYLLRAVGAVDRPDLGLLRHSLPRPWRVLRARRLRHGHVSDAPDRHPRRLCRSDPARLHGVPELEGAAVLLVWLPAFPLCVADDRGGARRARLRVRLVRIPQPRHRRLSVDHHAGAHLRADARLFPQQFRLRRQ